MLQCGHCDVGFLTIKSKSNPISWPQDKQGIPKEGSFSAVRELRKLLKETQAVTKLPRGIRVVTEKDIKELHKEIHGLARTLIKDLSKGNPPSLEVPLRVAMGTRRLRFLGEVGRVEPRLQIGAIDRLSGLRRPRELGELELVQSLFLLGKPIGAVELLPTAFILGRRMDLLERVNEGVVALLL